MKSLFLLFTSLQIFVINLDAQSIGPDSLFGGGDGMVYTSIFPDQPSEADGITLQSDHKILITGSTRTPNGYDHAFIARYNEDGSVDNSLNGTGIILLDLQENSYSNSILVQPDGKILVGVESSDSTGQMAWVLRFNENGTPDNSFDGDGKVSSPLYRKTGVDALVLQPDGKILFGGYAASAGYIDSFLIIRLLSNGAFDHSFDGDGILKFGVGEEYANVTSLMVQPDGKIIAAGFAVFNWNEDFTIARFNANGTLDQSFSGDGILSMTFSYGDDRVKEGLLQPDGKIVVAGFALNPINEKNDFAIARVNPDGTLDDSFHGNGMALTYITAYADGAYSLLRQPDGKLVMGGLAHSDLPQYGYGLTFARVNSNGLLDNTFDGDGVYTLENEMGTESLIYGMSLQPDGKIISAGIFRVNPLNKLMLFRITTGLSTATHEVDQLITNVSLYPNPVTKSMVLNYSLDKSQHIQFIVCDATGKIVDQLSGIEERTVGSHEEHLHLNKSLAPGNYYLMMKTNGGVKAIPIVKN